MCTGSTTWDWERCRDRLFIWSRIDCRQNDAQEFLLPSYFHFVRVLEVPCTEMFDCRVFRAWCVCSSFCWWCLLFYCQILRCIRCRRTCRLRGVPCFLGQVKCVRVVLQWGGVSWGSRLVWEENMLCPSGMRMPSGFFAILLFTQGLFDFKKCPNVPEFAAARLFTCVIS